MKYTSFTNDLRCMKCNKKLAETAGVFPALVGAKATNDGVKGKAIKLSIKCPRCGLLNEYGE
jgi:phage FluMu protein Com